MAQYDKSDLERRMAGAVESLRGDLSGLRTGRANVMLLDPVTVTVYGASMPLNQVATVSAPEPRMLSVQVWDKTNVGPVDKAIRSAGLGLNPITDGQTLRLPIPDLTEDRRKELAKLASKYAEGARIAVRNVRRDGMDSLKADEKKGEISEDERKRLETEVQKLTDDMIAAAGFTNIASEMGVMYGAAMPLELLAMSAPDLVITSKLYAGASRAEAVAQHPVVAAVAAPAQPTQLTSRDWGCGTPLVLRAIKELAQKREALTDQ